MDFIQLIEQVEDMIDNASSVPFSKKVMIDADELNDIMKSLRNSLPEEIKKAEWINEEQDRIIQDAEKEAAQIRSDAQREADRTLIDAKKKFEQMINDHDITKEAINHGNEIVERAQQQAKTLQVQSISYVDEKLVATQEKLKDLLQVLEENRAELRKN